MSKIDDLLNLTQKDVDELSQEQLNSLLMKIALVRNEASSQLHSMKRKSIKKILDNNIKILEPISINASIELKISLGNGVNSNRPELLKIVIKDPTAASKQVSELPEVKDYVKRVRDFYASLSDEDANILSDLTFSDFRNWYSSSASGSIEGYIPPERLDPYPDKKAISNFYNEEE